MVKYDKHESGNANIYGKSAFSDAILSNLDNLLIFRNQSTTSSAVPTSAIHFYCKA